MSRPDSPSRPLHAGLLATLMATLLVALPLGLPLPAPAAEPSDTIGLTDNLAAELARLPSEGVLVLMISLPDCHYCEGVREGYLQPLVRNPLRRTQYRVAEISLGLDLPITAFDGSATTIRRLHDRLRLRVAPTLLFVDRCGRELADRLVGGDVAGFYNAYFEQSLQQARARAKENAGLACTAS